jgi:hypothetical protein
MEFKNPYLATPPKERSRTTLEIPFSVVSGVKKYEPKDGAIQTTVSILLDKFLNEYGKRNHEIGDRAAYHNAVCGATIVLPGQEQQSSVTGTDTSRGTVTKPTTRRKPAKSKQAAD